MASILKLMVAWNPAIGTPFAGLGKGVPGSIKVGPFPGGYWSGSYGMCEGGGNKEYRVASASEREALIFLLFNRLVLLDRLDPFAVHKAFLSIDEYRAKVSFDVLASPAQGFLDVG